MKKCIAAALCALLLAAAWPALAAQEITLPGTQASVTLPKGWTAVTREGVLAGGERLDMSPKEAQQFMEENECDLYLFREEAEIYVMLFPSSYAQSVGNLTALEGEALEQVKRDAAEPYQGWTIDGSVERIERGGRGYLEVWMHSGQGDARLDNRQLFTTHDGWEVYIDLYASEDAQAWSDAQDALAGSLRFPGEAPVRHDKQALGSLSARKAVAYALAVHLLSLWLGIVGLAMAIYLGTRRQ